MHTGSPVNSLWRNHALSFFISRQRVSFFLSWDMFSVFIDADCFLSARLSVEEFLTFCNHKLATRPPWRKKNPTLFFFFFGQNLYRYINHVQSLIHSYVHHLKLIKCAIKLEVSAGPYVCFPKEHCTSSNFITLNISLYWWGILGKVLSAYKHILEKFPSCGEKKPALA